jgi:hypothetical protein
MFNSGKISRLARQKKYSNSCCRKNIFWTKENSPSPPPPANLMVGPLGFSIINAYILHGVVGPYNTIALCKRLV